MIQANLRLVVSVANLNSWLADAPNQYKALKIRELLRRKAREQMKLSQEF